MQHLEKQFEQEFGRIVTATAIAADARQGADRKGRVVPHGITEAGAETGGISGQ